MNIQYYIKNICFSILCILQKNLVVFFAILSYNSARSETLLHYHFKRAFMSIYLIF